MQRFTSEGTGKNLAKVATALDACTPINFRSMAILRLYFPAASKIVTLAPYASPSEDGDYTPCQTPLENGGSPSNISFTPTIPGNAPVDVNCFDLLFIKFLATFSDGTLTESLHYTMKS
jgi:hypothetical protein